MLLRSSSPANSTLSFAALKVVGGPKIFAACRYQIDMILVASYSILINQNALTREE